ncbi:MAG TPA: DUF3102 domain-containing protein [Rhodocyclaceae bacterium]|nr:DUF3102 domain-containing protein [Rhodocyclaceae bacterium]
MTGPTEADAPRARGVIGIHQHCTTDSTAADIERHHQLALRHASTAVEHAREAGRLLLEVKATLQHGEWLGWLTAHVSVSPRQAQRYMRAAQGKSLPAPRLLPSKNDTVSHLTLDGVPMPTFRCGELLCAVAVVPDGWRDEFWMLPAAGRGANVFVAHVTGPAVGDQLADEGVVWTYRRDPISVDRVRHLPLVFSFPWDRAEIMARRPHPGFEQNPFAEVAA